jgi:hypothetical protein
MFSADLGVTPSAANYIEDVFSTYLYTGNGSTQTITNGIDLSTKGGMVWTKGRSAAQPNSVFDTVRGATNQLVTNSTAANNVAGSSLTAFTSTGFTLGAYGDVNSNGTTMASWTFRDQAKFFDVVTYTGDGTGSRSISHSLDSLPGCIIVKRTDAAANWQVFHRSLATNEFLSLNATAAAVVNSTVFGTNGNTTTTFSVGSFLNGSSQTFVAYLFAHDAGGFGATGTDNVISCGSFTTNASGVATVSLGYEPQWILTKRTNAPSPWLMRDNMRGWTAPSGAAQNLRANVFDVENTSSPSGLYPTATGFSVDSAWAGATSAPFIYIAIRRGPMKTPTTGTSVFGAIPYTGTGSALTLTGLSFPPDYVDTKSRTGFGASYVADRLRGSFAALSTENTGAEQDRNPGGMTSFNMNGFSVGTYSDVNPSGQTQIAWCFRRAPGFFDVVCYTGTGSATTVSHNLGAVPELMIVKSRNVVGTWPVYVSMLGNTGALRLNFTGTLDVYLQYWNNTTPTTTSFAVGNDNNVNGSGSTYVAYLFATVAGVSKVGSYTGTGTTNQINCGFTGGARFVLIKRTDSTGDWYVWDSARGIVAGNDPYLLLNSTAAEVTGTDYVDTYSAGFEISSTAPAAINANGGSFIFLAIA